MERAYSRQAVPSIVEKTAARYDIPENDFLRASCFESGMQFNANSRSFFQLNTK